MKFQLNSHRVFFIGMGIIFLFLLLNRLQFYFGSKTAIGTVVTYTKRTKYNTLSYPVIRFEANGIQYRVKGLKDLNVYVNDNVEMIYQPSNPEGAIVNSFYGFWSYPILFCLIPFMLWVSFVYAYIMPRDKLFITLGKSEEKDENESKFRFVSLSKRISSKEK